MREVSGMQGVPGGVSYDLKRYESQVRSLLFIDSFPRRRPPHPVLG
jgi:hypothetical protein